MTIMYDYIDAGFRVFGLYGADNQGRCLCGDPDCTAVYKHPVLRSWQNVPDWSDDQLEVFEKMGHFSTGYGVLCPDWIIIDVDARNGGVDSLAKLIDAVPEVADSGFIVNTGSGGGSQHIYFKAPSGMALQQHLADYPGIDFKSSGFVVGCSSMHASGMTYERERGYPQDITEAPAGLVELLQKQNTYRVSGDFGTIDVDTDAVMELLSNIDPGSPYDVWIKIGMSIHHILHGDGFDLWDSWSANSPKYPGADSLERHWHSFGKSANPAGYGTLLHYAKEGGYVEPVTFDYEPPEPDHIDLLRPPGFVGELCGWINSQCLYPRESLAVAVALQSVSALAGMRYYDQLDDMTANMVSFCVAGSGTGKEALQQAYLKILRVAGMQGAVHGGFKSEQELMRNLIRHQAAFYAIDELGLVLRKLENASKKGGASYLEGLIGMIMSVYSKANGFLPVTGDLKEEIREKLRTEFSKTEKKLEDCMDSVQKTKLEAQSERLKAALMSIDDGIENPYLNILGYTTPVTFDNLMTFEQATNGFMARAMIFSDLETNPRRKKDYTKNAMSDNLAQKIRNLHNPGAFDMLSQESERVEYTGEKTPIPTTEQGRQVLDQVYEHFYQVAEDHKDKTGLEAIPRRGYEMVSKVSLVLALPEGVRTAEHIAWAFALAKRDVDLKLKMAYSTDKPDAADGLAARVLSIVSSDHGETIGVICNRLRSTPKEQVKNLIKKMVDAGMLKEVNFEHSKTKKTVTRYFSAE